MRIVETLLNRPEEIVFDELQRIANDNNLRVFAKTRLSDVIAKQSTILTPREFSLYTQGHFDFVLTDIKGRPTMVVEYDGPLHVNSRQADRDIIKNYLCRRVGLGILRIHAKHVTRTYRGMTLLRWIVEVAELQKAFEEAQFLGQIPLDEPFDPAFMEPVDSSRRFPYWLSAPATQSVHEFFKTLNKKIPKGWTGVIGYGEEGISHQLSCLYFEDKVIYAKASVRPQDVDFPHYDLLNEIVGYTSGHGG
jgi:hypothetical protein